MEGGGHRSAQSQGRERWVVPEAVNPTCSSVRSPLMLTQPLFCSGNYRAMGMRSVPAGDCWLLFPNFNRSFPMVSRIPNA